MTVKNWKNKVASLGCILCRHLDLGTDNLRVRVFPS